MKKILNLGLLICLIANVGYGQNEYYSKDSTLSVGIKLVDRGDIFNSKTCRVKKGDTIIDYSPYEVKEYGFKDGRIYLSKEIQISDSLKKVFLERLTKGEITLYYYKNDNIKTFFLEKENSSIVEIPKRIEGELSYKKQLLNITNECSNVAGASELVRYNKKSLTKLISRYNDCELKPFPHFKYGFTIGYELAKLIPLPGSQTGNVNYFDFKYDAGYTIGLFIDNPILVSDFSLHTELFYSRHGFSYNKLVDNQDIDFVTNVSSLKLPVLIRYAYPSNKFRPFLNIGGVIAFNIKNDSKVYETTISDKTIIINDVQKITLINDNQIGYSFGGGTEYRLGNKNSIFFELSYCKYYGLSDSESIKVSEIKFTTGISF